jgi:hypothetical protein
MAEEETFKVTDRRGRAREVDAQEPSESRPSPAGPASAGFDPSAATDEGRLDLPAIFLMFATSALVSLGEGADPATGEQHPDLGQARQAIDALLVLRDKTSGNRTEEEEQLLEELLYDLQMRFVRAAEARGAR